MLSEDSVHSAQTLQVAAFHVLLLPCGDHSNSYIFNMYSNRNVDQGATPSARHCILFNFVILSVHIVHFFWGCA